MIHRWKAGSTEHRMLADNDAILMLCGEELFGVRPFFHDVFFARLLAAWKQLHSTQKYPTQKSSTRKSSTPGERR